jgi:hypothetical protein
LVGKANKRRRSKTKEKEKGRNKGEKKKKKKAHQIGICIYFVYWGKFWCFWNLG